MQPRLSVYLPTYRSTTPENWRFIGRRAELLEQVGVDRIVVPDHVVFGERLADYGRPEVGGRRGGVQPTGPDGAWLEALTTLSFVAARTSRVRLGTAVLIAALRRPVVLAKTVATLDALAEGRVDLGVGVGWQREEYESAGIDFRQRGVLLDETLEICRRLWTTPGVVSYQSPRVSFEGIHMMPKPAQRGGVPIWVSGTVNERVARRLALYGQGWIPWGDDASDLKEALPRMRDLVVHNGRDPDDLMVVGEIRTGRPVRGQIDLDVAVAEVPLLVSLGVTDFQCLIPVPDDHDAAGELLEQLVAAFQGACS